MIKDYISLEKQSSTPSSQFWQLSPPQVLQTEKKSENPTFRQQHDILHHFLQLQNINSSSFLAQADLAFLQVAKNIRNFPISKQ